MNVVAAAIQGAGVLSAGNQKALRLGRREADACQKAEDIGIEHGFDHVGPSPKKGAGLTEQAQEKRTRVDKQRPERRALVENPRVEPAAGVPLGLDELRRRDIVDWLAPSPECAERHRRRIEVIWQNLVSAVEPP